MCAGVGSGGKFRRFRRVLVCAGGEFQGFGRFRRGLLPCNLDRNSHVIVFDHLLVIKCPHGQNHCGTRMRPCSQTWHKATAVGDTTKANYLFFVPCSMLEIRQQMMSFLMRHAAYPF